MFARHLSHFTFHTAALRLLSVYNIPWPTADLGVRLPVHAENSSVERRSYSGELLGKCRRCGQRSGCSRVQTAKAALTGLGEAPLPAQTRQLGAWLPRARINTSPNSLCRLPVWPECYPRGPSDFTWAFRDKLHSHRRRPRRRTVCS